MKPKKARLWLVPLFCYIAGLLVYLGISAGGLLLVQANLDEMPPRRLEFDNLYPEGMLLRESEFGSDLISADSDPRLLYSPGHPFYAGRVRFSAETVNRPGGEMVLYYTQNPGEDFSEARRLSARQAPDGSWYFDLGAKQPYSLRLDPATEAGILWRNWALEINAEKPLAAYFLPDTRAIFLFLFLPAFAAAAILEARQLLRDFTLRKKAKPRRLMKNTLPL